MPFLDSIVTYINDSLKGSSLNDKRFQPGKFCGVSTILARKKGEGLELLPAVEIEGTYKLVEPDDRLNIITYHKVVSNTYSMVKKSHGDSYYHKCTSEMAMVVFADAKKIRMSAEQLEPLLIYGMPQRLSDVLMKEIKFVSVLITPLASDMDKIRVFRTEYPGSEYFLKPYHHFFLLRYRIEATFDKNCIDACLCGDA